MEDGIDWNTPLLDELLDDVTVITLALAVVHSQIPSAWIECRALDRCRHLQGLLRLLADERLCDNWDSGRHIC
jgi:hypothetical protein